MKTTSQYLPINAPTLVIDDVNIPWFSWVTDGETIGYVSSLPEARKKAKALGQPCDYVYYLSSKVQSRL